MRSFKAVVWILLVTGVLMLALKAEPAQAGKSVCGGGGQQACGTRAATSLGRPPNVFNCPKGSFFDVGLESCWACPGGFERTLAPVTDPLACLKRFKQPKKERAKKIAKAGCPGGAFWDPIQGGTCWSCPDGFHRTAGHIEAANACAKATGFLKEELHSAIKVSGECPTGSFFDPIDGGSCWSCPTGTERTASSVKASDACIRYGDTAPGKEVAANKCSGVKTAETGAFWDPINGGTCWTCPKTHPIRTTAAVTSPKACAADKIVWQPAGYRLPGVFGISGLDAVLADVIRNNPDLIDLTAREVANVLGVKPEKTMSDTWAQLEKSPEQSLVLQSIAATKILDILMKKNPSALEQAIAKSVTAHYSSLRRYLASEMKQYYEAYTAVCNQRKAAAGMSALFNYGCKAQAPQDLIMHLVGADIPGGKNSFSENAIAPLSVVNGAASGAMIGMILARPEPIVKAVFPFARAGAKLAIERAGGEVTKAALRTAFAGSSAGLAGATLIASAGIEIAIVAGQQAMDIAEQAEQVNQAYRDAQRDMSVAEMTKWVHTETGYNDVKRYLGLMLTGTSSKGSAVRQAVKGHNLSGNTVETRNTNMPNLDNVKIKQTVVTQTNNDVKIKGETLIVRNTTDQNAGQDIQGHTAVAIDKTGFSGKLAQRFHIALGAGQDLCLGVKGGGNPANGNALELASCSDKNKALPFSVLGKVFLATKNNLCLDTHGHKVDAGPLELSPCKGTVVSQKWVLAAAGQIKSRAKNAFCVQAKGPMAPGTPVTLERCHNSPQQTWTAVK